VQFGCAVPTLEDKIVQRALAEVLNAIWEGDFLGFGYGFRPGRGQHDALDALAVGIGMREIRPYGSVREARSYARPCRDRHAE
jgi:hypothetical protein